MTETLSVEAGQAEERLARELVRDLHQPNIAIFWSDLIATALVGWAAFAVAALATPLSLTMFLAAGVSVVALYRGLCFVHEISHLNSRALRGFEAAWNALFGFPLLMPSFVYAGVHQYHHKLSTYGTKEDPEYLPFAKSAVMTSVFAVQSFLVPVLLSIRFLLLTPIGFVSQKLESWLIVHASSLTMNVAYRRQMSDNLVRKVRTQSAILWTGWLAFVVAVSFGLVPLRVWVLWLCVSAVASFINTLRTLGAHAYESSGESMGREEQLQDSIDTPGALWTELWAPVGLRYHALHHYFPGIPYHNLPQAYRRLTAHLEPSAAYHETRSPSLPHSLTSLLRKGLVPPR